jgi:uncharacterized membrane protein
MMVERRSREEQSATLEERVADAITRFTGSMRFICLHIAIFGAWIAINLGWPRDSGGRNRRTAGGAQRCRSRDR